MGGITSARDAAAARDAGADFLGFDTGEHSPRGVRPAQFAVLCDALPEGVQTVLVFDRTSHPDWTWAGTNTLARASLIQYAGEDVWAGVVREQWPGERKIRAFGVSRPADLRAVANFSGTARHVLLNLHAPPQGGFSDGDAFGWELAREARQFGKRVFLSGGLNADNVGDAVRRALPYAVDVTVGVESSPGVLDRDKAAAFVQAVRRADG